MLKFCVEKWDSNKDALKKYIEDNMEVFNSSDYDYLVKSVVDYIFNIGEDNYSLFDSNKITQINDGDYQGTLLFLIPRDTYQPSEYDYLMTYVGYGSCSGCDTLQAIQDLYLYKEVPEEQKEKFVNHMLLLCLHIVQNTIKPYNSGWRNDDRFETVEIN